MRCSIFNPEVNGERKGVQDGPGQIDSEEFFVIMMIDDLVGCAEGKGKAPHNCFSGSLARPPHSGRLSKLVACCQRDVLCFNPSIR
jgi:hypothetical protein